MKRKLIILLLAAAFLFTLSGCTGSTIGDNDQNKKSIKTEAEQQKIISQFEELLEGSANETDIIRYVDNNLIYLSKENASKLVLGVEQAQRKNIEARVEAFSKASIQEQLLKEFDYTYTIDKILTKIDDQSLKEFLTEIRESGYKLLCTEGSFYPIIDYELYKKYMNYITDELKDYIEIMAAESNNTTLNDAAITISWDELTERTFRSEKFINDYPDAKKLNEIKELYLLYVRNYLYGSDNTPTFEYSSKKLVSKVKENYLSLDLIDQKSKLVEIMKEYLPILEKNGYQRTKEVEKFLQDTLTELKETI